MIVSFKNNGAEYNNWNISDVETRQQLEAKGIDLVLIAKAEIQNQLLELQKQRLNEILDQYGYNSLGDVIFYANQATPDPEAQAILAWYQEYDNGIWNWIDIDLQAFTTIDELLQLDMKQVEENIFNQAVAIAPLP